MVQSAYDQHYYGGALMLGKAKKITALILCAASLSSLLISCANNEDEKKLIVNTENKEAGENEPVFEDYEFKDGTTFTILHIDPEGGDNYADRYIDSEARNGDPINDAVIDRNDAVEEKYNVEVVGRIQSIEEAVKAAKTGTVDFELIYNWGIRLAPPAVDGFFYDFSQIPYIDLTKSYWASAVQEELTVADKILVTTSDITMNRIAYADFIIFNKDLLDAFKVEYPYGLVDSNQWTVDEYLAMLLKCGQDVNGDSIMGVEDIYATTGMGPSFVTRASGIYSEALTKNEDGTYNIDFNIEKINAIYQKYRNLKQKYPTQLDFPGNEAYIEGRDISSYDNVWQAQRAIPFGEGHLAFDTTSFNYLADFRNFEDLNYGIAPIPKYEASQKQYYHYADKQAPMFAVIKQADMEKVGIIMEYMSYMSEKYLLPAFYEKTIKTKKLWDDRDAKICDIIRDSIVYSWTGVYYLTILDQSGKYWDPVDTIFDDMFAGGNIGSIYKKYSSAAQKSIDDIYDKVLELDVNK